MIRVNRPYSLIVPVYGGGHHSQAAPCQVITFLNDPHNRAFIRRVCDVPILHRIELLRTRRDFAIEPESRQRDGYFRGHRWRELLALPMLRG